MEQTLLYVVDPKKFRLQTLRVLRVTATRYVCATLESGAEVRVQRNHRHVYRKRSVAYRALRDLLKAQLDDVRNNGIRSAANEVLIAQLDEMLIEVQQIIATE